MDTQSKEKVPEVIKSTDPSLDRIRILPLHSVLTVTGVKAVTLYRWMRQGLFPRPINLGGRLNGWRYLDVKAWYDSLTENDTFSSLPN